MRIVPSWVTSLDGDIKRRKYQLRNKSGISSVIIAVVAAALVVGAALTAIVLMPTGSAQKTQGSTETSPSSLTTSSTGSTSLSSTSSGSNLNSTMLLGFETQVTSIDQQWGYFSFHNVRSNSTSISIAFNSSSPVLSSGQDVNIELVYPNLHRVVFSTAGKVTSLPNDLQKGSADVLVLNSSMPSKIPVSWGVKLGDTLTMGVYGYSGRHLLVIPKPVLGVVPENQNLSSQIIASEFWARPSVSGCENYPCVIEGGISRQLTFSWESGYLSGELMGPVNVSLANLAPQLVVVEVQPPLPLKLGGNESVTFTLSVPNVDYLPVPEGCCFTISVGILGMQVKPPGAYLVMVSANGYNDSALHGVPQNPWPIIKVQKGATIVILVYNADTQAHGFQVSHYFDSNIEAIDPQQTLSISFVANEAGTFGIYEAIPSTLHWAMQSGELIVS